jgi:glycosyltransferase involved in cell wall biosynthesis
MGRRTAGLGFLRGFVEHSGVDAFVGHGENQQSRASFEQAVRQFGGAAPTHWCDQLEVDAMIKAGALHVAGPVGAAHAFHRRAIDQRAWSLTGVTHTICSHTAMDAFASLMTGPVQSWDALICTSRAVRSVVEGAIEEQADYLRARLGAQARTAGLQLPVIPLGVRCQDFAADPTARTAIRQRLGVPDDAVLVLFAARLSFHAKAHPYPLYLALQRAAVRTGAKVHLLLASWFADAFQEGVFRNGAAELCPDVTLHVLDGREPGVWEQVWQAGDIYTLPSDNIQESFGLSPVEAMAAGLPVVGSDWNGLKDTIVHGETGFLAPTLTPPAGGGAYMSQAYDFRQIAYEQYVGATAMAVSVDVEAMAEAFTALIADAGLRARMGEAARGRAWAEYDWSRVIARYQELWAELGHRRKVDAEVAPRDPSRAGNPARADPFRSFAAYPTRMLAGTDRITLAPGFVSAVEALAGRAGVAPVRGVVVAGEDLQALAERMAAMPQATVEDVLRAAPTQPRWRVVRTVTWLHKHGLVTIDAAAPSPGAPVR